MTLVFSTNTFARCKAYLAGDNFWGESDVSGTGSGIYSASIQGGYSETNKMIIGGSYRDIFNRKRWGHPTNSYIWRIQIGVPLRFIWNRPKDSNCIRLRIRHMSLCRKCGSKYPELSKLRIKINHYGTLIDYPKRAKMLWFSKDITDYVRSGRNVIELESLKGTNLLHGVEKIEVVYE